MASPVRWNNCMRLQICAMRTICITVTSTVNSGVRLSEFISHIGVPCPQATGRILCKLEFFVLKMLYFCQEAVIIYKSTMCVM